jgi:hypothetical protein
MSLEGVQTDRAGHSSVASVGNTHAVRLSPPVFSKLNLSSILRPRRTKPHHGEDITAMRRSYASPSPRQTSTQDSGQASSPPQQRPIHQNAVLSLPSLVPLQPATGLLIEDCINATNPTNLLETGETKMSLPQSGQYELRLDSVSTTARPEPREAPQDPIVRDKTSQNQPESVEQARTRQKQGTTPKSTLDMENPRNYLSQKGASLNNNLKGDISRSSSVREEPQREHSKWAKEEIEPEHSEWAKDYVWQILRHNLRGAEGISGSVLVETEPCGTQRRLIVKCYGPAVGKAKAIRKLLEKAKRGLGLKGFILTVNEETRHGTDFSLLWGPGPEGSVAMGSNLSDFAFIAGVSDPSSRHGNTLRASGYHEADRFANTPYWNSTSILVECLFPPRPQLITNTLCGALVRMMSWEHQGESRSRTWTCGGLIHVNGIPYALTTAHPLVLDSRGKEQAGVDTTRPSVIDNVFPAEHGIFSGSDSNKTDGTQNWQTLGRVYKHAISSGDRVPANYDWLLIDITKDCILPNFPAGYNRDGDLGEKSDDPESVSICAWRGSLQATLLPGLSFMILGESSFKAMKLSVDQPMGESALAVTVQLYCQADVIQCKETPVHGSSGVKKHMAL